MKANIAAIKAIYKNQHVFFIIENTSLKNMPRKAAHAFAPIINVQLIPVYLEIPIYEPQIVVA
jgi:hypothetical protein